eukprot:TRINITY_DN2534_c0_g1_i1.p1 TRINITY_DN2534_c0_g1~~TRINITY_DN2534_c0_g1_i1.p1  ORF type:complete len:1746 (+),score=405.35 TRINITY_DN2534_c0_g1_i1:45-5282(+)
MGDVAPKELERLDRELEASGAISVVEEPGEEPPPAGRSPEHGGSVGSDIPLASSSPMKNTKSVQRMNTQSKMKVARMLGEVVDLDLIARDDTTPEDVSRQLDAMIYRGRAFTYLTPTHPFRAFCISIHRSPFFERVCLFFIFLNLCVLAAFDPHSGSDSTRNKLVHGWQWFYLVIFTLEYTVRATAQQLSQAPYALLSERSAKIQCLILLLSWIGRLSNWRLDLTPLRTVQILGTLRTLRKFPSMRIIVNALVRALPLLFDVITLGVIWITIFSIAGVEMFGNKLSNRCYYEDTGLIVDELQPCSEFPVSGYQCGSGQVCRSNDSPDYPNFNWIGNAFLVIMQCISQSGWTAVMYDAQDSTTKASLIYFVCAVLLGYVVTVNLALSALTHTFSLITRLAAGYLEEQKQMMQVVAAPMTHVFSFAESMQSSMLSGTAHGASKILHSKHFLTLMNVLIVLNIFLLSLEYRPQPIAIFVIIYIIDYAVELVLLFEMGLRMTVLGLVPYFKHRSHIIDIILVVLGAIEFGLRGNPVLVALRLLRLLKLTRTFRLMQQLADTLRRSSLQLLSFAMILILYLVSFAVVGLLVFGGQIDEAPDILEQNRGHFNTFLWSLVSCFQVVTTENWEILMYKTVTSTNSWWSSLFFIALLLPGAYMIMNLFVAIILERFVSIRTEDWEKKKRDRIREKNRRFIKRELKQTPMYLSTFFTKVEGKQKRAVIFGATVGNTEGPDGPLSPRSPRRTREIPAPTKPIAPGEQETFTFLTNTAVGTPRESLSPDDLLALEERTRRKSEANLDHIAAVAASAAEGQEPPPALPASPEVAPQKMITSHKGPAAVRSNTPRAKYPLFLIPPDHPLRLTAIKAVYHEKFPNLILFFVMMSTVTLALESPDTWKIDGFRYFLIATEWLYVFVFGLEILLKCIANEMYMHPRAYLRSYWNCLDLFQWIVTLLSLLIVGFDLRVVWGLRAFRVLRPIRLIRSFESMKVAIQSLLASMPLFFNAIIVTILVWFIFAVIGVLLYQGKFEYCNDLSVAGRDECQGSFLDTDGFIKVRTWANPPYNFDDVPSAMLALFEVSTLEGWLEIMYSAVDSRGGNLQPVFNYSPGNVFFFLVFIIIGSYFAVNLFIGVMVDIFSRIEEDRTGVAFLSKDQLEWLEIQRMAFKSRAMPVIAVPVPTNPLRRFLLPLFMHESADYVQALLISCHVIFLLSTHYPRSTEFDTAFRGVNAAVTAIYILECAMRTVAMLPRPFWAVWWNRFDVAICFFAFIGIFASPALLSISLSLRLIRLLALTKKNEEWRRRSYGVRLLLRTVRQAVPQLINIGSILFLLLYMYAIIAIVWFGNVAYGQNLTRSANFRNFAFSLLTLFRMLTGEYWNGIMRDCKVQPPHCEAPHCGSPYAALFFISFMTFVTFFVMNLFIAVILQGLEQVTGKDDHVITDPDVQHFTKMWSKYDPDASGYLPVNMLGTLLRDVGPPLGLLKFCNNHHERRMLIELDLPVHTFMEIQPVHGLKTLPTQKVVEKLADKPAEKPAEKPADEPEKRGHTSSGGRGDAVAPSPSSPAKTAGGELGKETASGGGLEVPAVSAETESRRDATRKKLGKVVTINRAAQGFADAAASKAAEPSVISAPVVVGTNRDHLDPIHTTLSPRALRAAPPPRLSDTSKISFSEILFALAARHFVNISINDPVIAKSIQRKKARVLGPGQTVSVNTTRHFAAARTIQAAYRRMKHPEIGEHAEKRKSLFRKLDMLA